MMMSGVEPEALSWDDFDARTALIVGDQMGKWRGTDHGAGAGLPAMRAWWGRP